MHLTSSEIKIMHYVFDRQLEAIMGLYEGKFKLFDFAEEFPTLEGIFQNTSLEFLEYLSEYYTLTLFLKDHPDQLFMQRPSILLYFRMIMIVWIENLRALDEDAVNDLLLRFQILEQSKLN